MSKFGSGCYVVKIDNIQKHPNADNLDLVTINEIGLPLVTGSNQYNINDEVIYVPPDMIPGDAKEFNFLGENRYKKVKAKKLRGYLSHGMILPKRSHHKLGDNVMEELGITKYIPPQETKFAGNPISIPEGTIKYTDIESLSRYPDVIPLDTEVVILEKVDGSNIRFGYVNENFVVGSHNQWIERDDTNLFWRVVNKYGLEEKLYQAGCKRGKGNLIFGEVYGYVNKLRYGAKKGEIFLCLFDIYSIKSGKFYDWHLTNFFLRGGKDSPFIGQIPPILYKGKWKGYNWAQQFVNGPSLIYPEHTREGIVIKPVKEMFDEQIGRVILKQHSEAYLLK